MAIAAGCYAIWGILPAYWNLMSELNPLFILCCRIVLSFAFAVSVLAVSKRLKVLRDTLRNKAAMKCLLPASIIIACNWGLYIWAVNSGRVLDSSLGYYMNPLTGFLLGILLFREKFTKLQIAAVALALTGVAVSLIAYGSFPFVAVGLTLTFASYGALKKNAHADPVASIAIETLIITPIALIFALVFMKDSFSSVSTANLLLLLGSGAATAVPLIMYARAINEIPFIIVCFLQYISPSLTLIYGLISGEPISAAQLISFIFIGLGLIVFSVALVKIAKKAKAESVGANKA